MLEAINRHKETLASNPRTDLGERAFAERAAAEAAASGEQGGAGAPAQEGSGAAAKGGSPRPAAAPAPARRPAPPAAFEGTGRNDPCPCGSGKKFKKCHGS